MKKQYNNPQIKIVTLRPVVMTTTSVGLYENAGKGGVVLSRDSGWWDDEEEE